jgi:putative N-acetylmannosamine-6-phosphate epimerase
METTDLTKTTTETSSHTGNGNLESKVEHILISKTKMIYGIIVILVPIIGIFYKIQLDVALIKQNHSAHIEAIANQIKDLQTQQTDLIGADSELRKQLNTDHDAIIRLLQQHDQ